MTVGQYVNRHLPVQLTPDEIKERLERSATLVGAIEEAEEAQRDAAKKAKEEIASQQGELSRITKEARNREAFRDVRCVWRANYAAAEATLVRTDTGVVVERRGLTDDEMQTRLPSIDQVVEDDDHEPTAPAPTKAKRSPKAPRLARDTQ